MRICLDISPLTVENLTGVGEYIKGLVNNIYKLNVNNTSFFAFIPWNYDTSKIYKHIPQGIKIKTIKLPFRIAVPTFILWEYLNYPSIDKLVGDQFDIYDCFDWYVPKSHNVKIVTTVFDLSTIHHKKTHKVTNTILQNTKLHKLINAARISVISEYTKMELLNFSDKIQGNKVDIIYPGIKDYFYKYEFLNTDNRSYGKYILCVCTNEPRKNLETVVQAFSKVRKTMPTYSLVIVGAEGWGPKTKVKDGIHFLGYVDDQALVSLYKNCEFTIYIPIYEGFGLPIIESMFFGKNVITGKNSSLSEAGGIYAKYVQDVTNVEEVSKKILEITNIEESDNAEKINWAKKFNYQESAQQTLNLYTKIV